MRRTTLIDFFEDLASATGDFVVHDDSFRTRTFTYTDVGRASRTFAARLAAHGIVKGDTVVVFSENRPEWIVAFWGCLLIGAVVVPIDYRSSPDFLVRVANIVRARVVLVGQDVPPLRGLGAIPLWPLHDLDWETTATPPSVSIVRDDVAEIIFTSGATADPKGVVITHRNVLANIVPVEGEVLKFRKYARPFSPIRFLNLLPLSHMFGQAMATFIPPMLTGVVVFMRGYNPGDIADQIRKRRVSVLVSVPKILDVLKEHALRIAPSAAGAGQVRTPGLQGPGALRAVTRIAGRWWHHRDAHRIFGAKFWAFIVGAAPLDGDLEKFWGDLGFAVIQGYGLTETAPIVTLNHPFGTKRGSVGKAIAGVEMKVGDDGEILVRGENVTQGYFNAADETAKAFEDGWFHTGDIGEIGPDGQVFIRGRKKEMIVTPEGLNVFPEDVERVLNQVPGVRDSAVVGISAAGGGNERVHAVLVTEPGLDLDAVVREANAHLADHQKIRRALLWPEPELPRTEGTRKLKRALVRDWARSDGTPRHVAAGSDALATLVAKYAGREQVAASATIEELGLSSLERVELMVALEDAFGARIDEGAFAQARSVADLKTLVDRGAEAGSAPPAEPVDFPAWNRSRLAWLARRISLPTWILPLGRLFVSLKVEGLEHLARLDRPVIFAVNHQSHFDVPMVLTALPSRIRYRIAPAMAKEFFKAHFFPDQYGRKAWFTNSLNYYLAALFFNAFPLPQREAGTRQTLRYIGEVLESGYSVLIFPEGKRTDAGEINTFRPGIGMIASKLDVAVVPVRIDGLDKVLHHTWKWPKRGPAHVAFGAPLHLAGDDYEALARSVETAVRAL
ncbi:MAG: AMP-binding protein [Vicinamibacterales bacterium]